MGTGIVANAAAGLPVQIPALRAFATGVWVVAVIMLVTVSSAFVGHWRRHRANARGYATHPGMSQFYGAPPMALLTVGVGTLLLGRGLIGVPAAVLIAFALWIAGTVLGLATSLWIPYRMITRDAGSAQALPSWLMPVVPPMVSASSGALLLPYVPSGQWRMSMLLACYALFGLSLIVGMLTITMVYSRLLHQGAPTAAAAPTVWISLGIVGQSITAANLLGGVAGLAIAEPFATGLRVFGLIFGVAMGGFGVLFFALAVALTAHAARRGMPFALTWWSFTFPIGTCVTGASTLGHTSGSTAILVLAVGLYLVLLGAWGTVAARTIRGLATGRLLERA